MISVMDLRRKTRKCAFCDRLEKKIDALESRIDRNKCSDLARSRKALGILLMESCPDCDIFVVEAGRN